jgi:hypothetical protein
MKLLLKIATQGDECSEEINNLKSVCFKSHEYTRQQYAICLSFEELMPADHVQEQGGGGGRRHDLQPEPFIQGAAGVLFSPGLLQVTGIPTALNYA